MTTHTRHTNKEKRLQDAGSSPVSEDGFPGVSGFVAEIGHNVRYQRQEQAITRKVLSNRSGVSERYLAQLEIGNGNISVAVLFKIALALGLEPSDLLPGSRSTSQEVDLLQLFRNADSRQQLDAIALLRGDADKASRAQRVCLIGLRGAGKSTLGRQVAKTLGIEFIELNDAIERQCGMAVQEIMALYGQEGYRSLGLDAIEAIAESRQRVILAAGGGLVSDPDAFDRLMTSFHSIWLKAAPEEHMNRVLAQGDNRPVAGNPRAMEDLRAILRNREALYAQADHQVDTTGRGERACRAELQGIIARVTNHTGQLFSQGPGTRR